MDWLMNGNLNKNTLPIHQLILVPITPGPLQEIQLRHESTSI